MSIRGELNKSADYLRNARKAILGRGGEISLTAGLKDLPKAIYNIPSGASLAYQSDTNVAYQKIVPVGTQEFAQVTKIGGMTYKCPVTNYLKITGTISDQLSDALIINSDGSITILSGDPDSSIKGSVEFDFDFEAPSGDYYFFATGDDISEGVTVSIVSEWFDEYANVWDGMLLELGSSIHVEETHRFSKLIVDFGEGDGGYGYGTPLTFKLWIAKTTEGIFEGLRDTKVTELVSEGAQLIPFPYRKAVGVPTTQSGVTFTVLEDGGISVVGIPTDETTYVLGDYTNGWQNILKIGETYTISGGKDKVIVNIRTCPIGNPSSSSAYIESANSKSQSKVFPEGREVRVVGLYIHPKYIGQEINTVIYPMLNRGSIAAPYKPYRADAVDTLAIAEEIRAIEGYGIGKSGTEYNYIDLEIKVFKQDYAKIRLLSTMGNYNADTDWYYIGYTSLGIAPIDRSVLCNILPSVDIQANKTAYGIYHNSSFTHVVIRIQGFTTAAEYKQWLADNEVYIIEKLAEPIETDISPYLPSNFISVEGGGAITFVNEFEQKAPSTINYIFETEGA